MEEKEEKVKRPISIRGLDEDAYKGIVELAKSTGETVGKIASEAFRLYLAMASAGEKALKTASNALKEIGEAATEGLKKTSPRMVSNIGELSLSASDLESFEGPVAFSRINHLVFEDDVSEELFREKVLTIVNCEVVEVPKAIPKPLVLSKARFVKRIDTRS